MKRGTTPTHTFVLPFDTSLISEVRIIYVQNDETILLKKRDDCVLEDKTISVTLTQDDTFKFDAKRLVSIQIRVLTHDNVALASDLFMKKVGECLDNEVIT